MARVGTWIGVVTKALDRFDRSQTPRVREAYRSLALETTRRGDEATTAAPTPRQHVLVLALLSFDGVHIVPRSELAVVRRQVDEWGCLTEAVQDGECDDLAESFDPAKHALVATQVTPLAYLEEADLGAGARLVAPHLKCALLWWEE
jgi:hypothetical protein